MKLLYEYLYKNFDYELDDINIQSVLSSPSEPCLDDKVTKTFDEHFTEKDVLQDLKK